LPAGLHGPAGGPRDSAQCDQAGNTTVWAPATAGVANTACHT